MTTYATAAEVRAELADLGWRARLPQDDDALERLIVSAEQDVDQVVGGPYSPDAERKHDPDELTAPQRAALVRAVAAQCMFRQRFGEAALVEGDDRIRSMGDLSFVDRPPHRISPAVAEHLAGRGLLRATRTAAPDRPESETAP